MQEQAAGREASEPSGSRWQTFAAIGGIVFGLVNFYDPAKDIYKRFSDPAAFKDVVSIEYADSQKALWQKNGLCVATMDMVQIPLGNTVDLRAGSCANRDILVQMYPENKPAISHWMSLSQITEAKAAGANLFPAAFAAALTPGVLAQVQADSTVHKAQMKIATVCQAWEDDKRQARLIRVTNENGQCFKEITNVYSGRIEFREQTACDTQCKPAQAPVR
jgi:hypothetical protein